MKKKKGFVLRRIAGEGVIVGESLDLINFDNLVSLNPPAAYIWEELESWECFDASTVASLLICRYKVDIRTARQDAIELLSGWLQAGIIEE